ncbi:phosphoribosylglycinamide formyltransferase [Oceanidesulfovibrio marinus]|uniref:Phosphoribosylglycinamide formyltransferase n=1 Tax=Oceanidesulfovibrio marinus TaxID=370038 RepID=A0A6P1ZHU8_9BACT|nr:phosphoribosylglycinamide formyltransferase [Oceanidesulfovibrio marinus]QJT10566.1 phosphoribosylglycinamide formyltransferase [Oceanidesulfovibrio marinus]TVM34202.1 phosphoribosylglycinamide formyltransferase [Oceanidesulfovibrio marinus]
MKLAVLVSGSGSNLQSIIDHVEAGHIAAEIAVVFSNKEDAYGLTRARNHGIPTAVIQHTEFTDREAFDAAMVRALQEHGADTVALAGFMRMLTPVFLNAFPMRVLNIHPALLPSFPGTHGQHDAATFGVRLAGCTVHFVDEKMDHGPVVIQAALPVTPGIAGDDLAGQILRLEHRVYPQALAWMAQDRIRLDGRIVHIEGSGVPVCDTDGVGPYLVNPPLEDDFAA